MLFPPVVNELSKIFIKLLRGNTKLFKLLVFLLVYQNKKALLISAHFHNLSFFIPNS